MLVLEYSGYRKALLTRSVSSMLEARLHHNNEGSNAEKTCGDSRDRLALAPSCDVIYHAYARGLRRQQPALHSSIMFCNTGISVESSGQAQ